MFELLRPNNYSIFFIYKLLTTPLYCITFSLKRCQILTLLSVSFLLVTVLSELLQFSFLIGQFFFLYSQVFLQTSKFSLQPLVIGLQVN